MGPLLVNIDVILLLLLLTVATLVGVCGSRGTGLVPLSDGKFAFLTTQKAEFLHNAKNFPKSGPEMAPEAEAAMPPKLQVVSHTKPPASSPDQLLSGQRHSIVGSPSTQSPRIWFGPGPATLPTWSSPAITHGQINSAPALCPLEAPARILPAQHSHIRGLAPISSPKSPNATVPTDVASPPLIPNLKPGERKQAQLPVLSSMGSLPHSRRIGASSPLHTPMHSNFPSSHQGPSIPPLASIENHSSAASHKEKRRHVSSPIPGPHPSFPVHPPFPITAGPIHAFAPSPTAFSSPFETGVPPHSGVFPFAPAPRSQPSRVLSPAPAPKPRHAQALPPPPSNLDCSSLSCMEPLTYSPPVSPCACVQPMKVSLRLGVELYTFFPLVSELAQEIASGTFLKQSQVRIMGANAGSEQPEKTIVLIDLVPFGERFGNSIAFYLYERFWQKQVKIRMTYFGDYDVLYINYPGLPPPPPMSPSNVNVGNGRFGRKNNSRTEHPLGVDVGRRKEKLADSMIAIVVLSSVIALVLCAGVGWLFILKRNRQSCLPSQSQSIATPFVKVPAGIGPTLYGSGCCSTSGSLSSSMATYSAKTFSAVEIEKATNKFDDANIIGEGGFGRVYLGVLEDGIQVAVKVLKREDQQGSREFLSEVEMLSRLHHRNLVKLIGICTEEHLRCLVYELIPNGSVESHLHGVDKETSPLDWSARMKIALGSARGLAYLHEDSNPRVIHRDFKSSNILLEHNFTAKVSDFGLARTAKEEGKEHISTRVMGTFGYVAPEYAMTGHLLVKSDVYSYGVVLLELLTGRKPVDMLRAPGQENLVSWARPLLTTREGLETLIDPAMGSDVPLDSVAKVAAIASMCIQSEVSHRPFMGEVVQALKLVCSEHDEHHASESGSCDDLSKHDTDIKSNGGLASETERVLSASEIFSMPMGLARNASDSFRRLSSSGPLKTTKKSNFWRRVRGLSRRSVSKHGP